MRFIFLSLILSSACTNVICPEIISKKRIIINHRSKINDACVSFLNNDRNYDSIKYNWTGCWEYGETIGNEQVEFYIKFDYSEISENAKISSAKINFYACDTNIFRPNGGHVSDQENPNAIRISKVETNWHDSTLIWLNKPETSFTEMIKVNASTHPYQDYLGLDVTKIVRSQLKNGNFGFAISLIDPQTQNRVLFHSSESSHPHLRPSIEISYEE